MDLAQGLAQGKDALELFDVALIDLAWGLLVAALIGVVGGLVYATLTRPPPEDILPQDDADRQELKDK